MTTPAKQTSAQFAPLGTVSAPADWNIPSNVVLTPSIVFAHFDGTSAAGSFVPTLQILSDSGHVVAEIPQDVTVAAGSSCEATWAPFLRTQPASSTLTTSIVAVGLQGETFPIWQSTTSGILDSAAGQLFTQVFPYGFAKGTKLTGACGGVWSNQPSTGNGHMSFGVCDTTGKVLATTGNLGTSTWTVEPGFWKAPFTAPLTLTSDTKLYGWCHGFSGTWNAHPAFAVFSHSATFLQQSTPHDWFSVFGATPPSSVDSAFGSTAPALGATINLHPTDATGSSLAVYIGVY